MAKNKTKGMRSYFKGVDENLCGRNGFQYEIGKTFFADTTNTWHWLHFAEKASTALIEGSRVLEVIPVDSEGKQIKPVHYRPLDDLNSERIHVIREVPKEELFNHLLAEKCPFRLMEKLQPPASVLDKARSYFKREDNEGIINCDYLSLRDKLTVLPQWYHRRAERVDMIRSFNRSHNFKEDTQSISATEVSMAADL